MKSREPNCSPEDFELGRERSAEVEVLRAHISATIFLTLDSQLTEITRTFILRRGGEVNAKYLPPKQEIVVFVKPSEIQRQLYNDVTQSNAAKDCLRGGAASNILSFITILKKLVNSPSLVSNSVFVEFTLSLTGVLDRRKRDRNYCCYGKLFS